MAYTLKTIAKEQPYFQSKNKNKKTDAETDAKTIIKQSRLQDSPKIENNQQNIPWEELKKTSHARGLTLKVMSLS